MKRINRFMLVLSGVAGSMLSLLPLSAIAKEYSGINIFGDSLVDAGNLFNLTGLPPSPPYAQKLSNGVVWVEPLAEKLGLSPALATEVVPGLLTGTTPPPTDGLNFALGGSLSSDQNVGTGLPGLQQQIETFGALSPVLQADDDALFVLLAGGNDYNLAIASPEPTAVENITESVTNNLASAASALIGLGAKHLIVPNLPDLALQPRARQLDTVNPQASLLLSQFSTQHNQRLSQKLTGLSLATETKITQLDLNSLLSDVVANPGEFGFSNVEDSCVVNIQNGFFFDGVCNNPEEFAFWDDVHPTAAVHELIAAFAHETLKGTTEGEGGTPQEVPEPASVVSLLLIGAAFATSIQKAARVH